MYGFLSACFDVFLVSGKAGFPVGPRNKIGPSVWRHNPPLAVCSRVVTTRPLLSVPVSSQPALCCPFPCRHNPPLAVRSRVDTTRPLLSVPVSAQPAPCCPFPVSSQPAPCCLFPCRHNPPVVPVAPCSRVVTARPLFPCRHNPPLVPVSSQPAPCSRVVTARPLFPCRQSPPPAARSRANSGHRFTASFLQPLPPHPDARNVGCRQAKRKC